MSNSKINRAIGMEFERFWNDEVLPAAVKDGIEVSPQMREVCATCHSGGAAFGIEVARHTCDELLKICRDEAK